MNAYAKASLTLFCILSSCSVIIAQTGSLQIYCISDVNIYINNKFAGKTNHDMSGITLHEIPIGEKQVRAYREGYQSVTQIVTISENSTSEITIILSPEQNEHKKEVGLTLYMGTFGLFNVNSIFTKADYSIGFTPHIDIRFHKHFSAGAEIMTIWGKPKTMDNPRLMINPNFRLCAMFSPRETIKIQILIASGFAWWPANSNYSYLTPSFNENRFGWDFRAMAGFEFLLTKKTSLTVHFGYWASSSTGDNIIWITHDSMLAGFGPVFRF